MRKWLSYKKKKKKRIMNIKNTKKIIHTKWTTNCLIIKNISKKPCKVCAACFARFEQDKSKYVSIFHTGNEEEEEGTEEESTKLFNFLSIDTIPPSCQLLPQISDSSDSESNNDEKDRQICFDDTKFKDTHQIPMQKTKRSCKFCLKLIISKLFFKKKIFVQLCLILVTFSRPQRF